jgi:NADH:ubiquinone oxidoreductase subunit H
VIQILLAGGLYWVLIARFGRSQYDQTLRMGWQLIGR